MRPRRVLAALLEIWRFAKGYRHYLRDSVDAGKARRTIGNRLEKRSELLLGMVRSCIYDNPNSPYLRLCEWRVASTAISRTLFVPTG